MVISLLRRGWEGSRGCVERRVVGTHERVREGAVRGLVVRRGVDAAAELDCGWSAYGNVAPGVVDAAAVGKDVNVCTLGAKLAVALWMVAPRLAQVSRQLACYIPGA